MKDFKIELPTFTEASKAVDLNNANPLEKFIFENEPAGNEDGFLFRVGLIDLLNYAHEEIDDFVFENNEEAEFYRINDIKQ